MKRYILLLFIGILFFSCNDTNNTGDIVAELDGEYLYRKDIDAFFGTERMEKDDSVNKARGIINQWALRKIFYKKAEVNVPKEDVQNLEGLVQKYREDLIINEYQNLLITQKFSEGLSSEKETYKYYEKNKNLFKLNSNIIKLNYVVIPKNFGSKNRIKEIFKKDTLEENLVYEIESLCYGITQNYSLKDSLWKSLSDIEKIVDIKKEDISKGKILEIPSENYIWIIKVNDFKKEGSLAPFDYIKDRIKNIRYNEGKLEFMKEIERDLLENYIKNDRLKTY